MATLNSFGVTNGNYVTAVAWVNFNGNIATPSTIRSQFNVSSITRNGTGDYTVNFSSGLGDGEYAVASIVGDFIASNGARTLSVHSGTAPASGSCRLANLTGSGAANNVVRACAAFFR